MEKPGSIRWEVAQVAIGLILGVTLCLCAGCESRIQYESKPTPITEPQPEPTYQAPVDCYAVMFICRNCGHKWPQTFPIGEEWGVSECPLCRTNCGLRLKHQEYYSEELGRE